VYLEKIFEEEQRGVLRLKKFRKFGEKDDGNEKEN
jgi:hypothetical protein